MLSVVIPAYNEEKCIGQCLFSLTKQDTKEPFEVIVVNNASTDRTAEVAQQYEDRLHLRVIQEEHKGRGRARTAGFALAKGDIILSTDADTIVPPHWIEALSSPLRTGGNVVGVSSPCIFMGSTRWKRKVLSFQWILMRLYRFFWGHFWLNGFSFAIRKDTYEKAGGFNADIDSQEDTDLSKRVAPMGIILFLPGTAVVTSARRFERNIFKGLWEYFSQFFLVRLSRGKIKPKLSDTRE